MFMGGKNNDPVKMANFMKTVQEVRVQDGHASAVPKVLHGCSSHYILLHIHGLKYKKRYFCTSITIISKRSGVNTAGMMIVNEVKINVHISHIIMKHTVIIILLYNVMTYLLMIINVQ